MALDYACPTWFEDDSLSLRSQEAEDHLNRQHRFTGTAWDHHLELWMSWLGGVVLGWRQTRELAQEQIGEAQTWLEGRR